MGLVLLIIIVVAACIYAMPWVRKPWRVVLQTDSSYRTNVIRIWLMKRWQIDPEWSSNGVEVGTVSPTSDNFEEELKALKEKARQQVAILSKTNRWNLKIPNPKIRRRR